MSLKIKELSPRQRRVLQKLAEGLPPATVAKELGYRPEHVSRLQCSELGRFELERLRAEAEATLASALPKLVVDSVAVLEKQLQSPILEVRTQAAHFVLRWLAPKQIKGTAKNIGQVFEVVPDPVSKDADKEFSITQLKDEVTYDKLSGQIYK
ncbi:hypothetical protein ACH50O_10975 [Methylomonas sp. 2BW1-5-20]|uniref:hypothetical protein n=1 Tax=Methylomonas sp. 2BW1-5-20 TaxID=3376686 RepID=UPI00404FDF07